MIDNRRKRSQYMKIYMKKYRERHPEKYSTEATRDARLRHYYRNRERLLRGAHERREAHQEIANIAKSVTCADCGESYPPFVMDFDHVRGRKEFQIGGSLHLALDRLLKEIDKCDVVCSNCHRFRTFTHGTKPA